jgi:UDP:flavonoid glycosyltransferase YjiC (YdhE family)
MRVLMSTWGWRSHFYCLAPLGWALQAAGHEVRVAAPPSTAAAVAAAGLAAVPVGRDLPFAEAFAGSIGRVGALDAPQRSDASGGRASADLEPEISPDGGVVRLAEAMLDELVAFGRHWRPEVMVWEPFNLAAAVACAVLGVPGLQHLWGPDSSGTLRLDQEAVFGPLAGRFGRAADGVRLTGDALLDPAPPPLQVPPTAPALPVRFVPYNGTAVLPDWLRAPGGRPRVCVTAGTMMAGAGLTGRAEPLAAAAAAAARLGAEVVVVVEQAHRSRFAGLPGDVRLADAPLALRLLLPTCSAIVHQGGAGTMMTALARGVPQLVLPQVSDQHFNAGRLALAGCGRWLDPESGQPSEAADAMAEVLADGPLRDAAADLADRVRRMPAPAALVPLLEARAAAAV